MKFIHWPSTLSATVTKILILKRLTGKRRSIIVRTISKLSRRNNDELFYMYITSSYTSTDFRSIKIFFVTWLHSTYSFFLYIYLYIVNPTSVASITFDWLFCLLFDQRPSISNFHSPVTLISNFTKKRTVLAPEHPPSSLLLIYWLILPILLRQVQEPFNITFNKVDHDEWFVPYFH